MKMLVSTCAALLGLAAFMSSPLHAQAPFLRPPGAAPTSQPAFSPYLNLLRNGNPTYLNYYGLVRPEIDFRNQLSGVQQGVEANASALAAVDPASGLPLTGHPTQFLNTSHYFLNRGGQGAAGASHGTSRPAVSSPSSSPGR